MSYPCPRKTESHQECKCLNENEKIEINNLTMEEKCDLMRNVLLSEAISIFEDFKEATLDPKMTISQIAAMDMENWLISRHPLLLAISDGLSKVNTL